MHSTKRQLVHVLSCEGLPIFEQLQLEEALLRADRRNWCLWNSGSTPAIVLGISGKVHEMVAYEQWQQLPLPLIRRFSGGGTVVVDADTCFTTFIGQVEEIGVPAKIEAVHQWAEQQFLPLFAPTLGFRLRENDYVLGERKCGGNAQYFTRNRWLHHTSFLWNYSLEHMQLLRLPPKMPQYRQQRPHTDFICTLQPHFTSKTQFKQRLLAQLQERVEVIEVPLASVLPLLELPHRKATELCAF